MAVDVARAAVALEMEVVGLEAVVMAEVATESEVVAGGLQAEEKGTRTVVEEEDSHRSGSTTPQRTSSHCTRGAQNQYVPIAR